MEEQSSNRVVRISDGDEIVIRLETPESRVWDSGTVTILFSGSVPLVHIVTPKYYQKLRRGYLINWVERWTIIQVRIWLCKLRRWVHK